MVPPLEDPPPRGELSLVSIQAFLTFTSQEPDKWEPETDDEAETEQVDKKIILNLILKIFCFLQEIQEDTAGSAEEQEVISKDYFLSQNCPRIPLFWDVPQNTRWSWSYTVALLPIR